MALDAAAAAAVPGRVIGGQQSRGQFERRGNLSSSVWIGFKAGCWGDVYVWNPSGGSGQETATCKGRQSLVLD